MTEVSNAQPVEAEGCKKKTEADVSQPAATDAEAPTTAATNGTEEAPATEECVPEQPADSNGESVKAVDEVKEEVTEEEKPLEKAVEELKVVETTTEEEKKDEKAEEQPANAADDIKADPEVDPVVEDKPKASEVEKSSTGTSEAPVQVEKADAPSSESKEDDSMWNEAENELPQATDQAKPEEEKEGVSFKGLYIAVHL